MADPVKFHTSYREIQRLKPSGIRGQLRTVALDALSVLDKLKGIEDDLRKPRVQFIYIHHIFKDEEAPLHRLLDTLAATHSFISYSEAVERILTGRVDAPYACISSDDGFKNNVGAAEILAEHGAPSCFFINPSIIGVTSPAEIAQYCQDMLHFPTVEFMDWADVDRVLALGHEIGSHTMSHRNVAELERASFEEDCQRSFQVITQRCGGVKHFAFPYGRFHHFNEMGKEVVFQSGFTSCATAERGCHINHGQPLRNEELCIRRDHVILNWNINHILHFLARNARQASTSTNLFPYAP